MLHRSPSPSHRRRSRLRAVVPVLLGLSLALPLAPSAAASTEEPSGPCTDDTGVTVVVDLTDLGGQIEVGCATGAQTGTEALQAARFTDTRDAAGLICAVDGLPDPCPTTFEGSFWSYWYGEPGGEWQTYLEGPDTAVPVSGQVEGWRYNDGSEGPGLAPPVAGEPLAEPTVTATPTEGATTEDEMTTQDGAAAEDAQDAEGSEPAAVDATDGPSPAVWAGLALLALLGLAALVTVRRRSGTSRADGPAGQD